MNGAMLDTLVVRLQAGDFGDVHSLLVARHGKLVLERYFAGWSADEPHPVYSVTKSVTALLVGMARDAGADLPLDGRLLDFFPERQPVANPSVWKDAITFGDVLTMRAGFVWDEGAVPYREPGNPTTELARSADWVDHMLDLPMAGPPGSDFRYNSGCSVLMGAMLAARIGASVTDFAATHLLGPLDIDDWDWETGPVGVTNTGWGLSLRPSDLAKVGQLVLDQGVWRERRLVSEDWLRESTEARVLLSGGFGYGYQWWRLPRLGGVGEVVLAWGWGDQFLFIAPGLDLVVVTTGGNYDPASDDRAIEFVPRYVFGAVMDAGAR